MQQDDGMKKSAVRGPGVLSGFILGRSNMHVGNPQTKCLSNVAFVGEIVSYISSQDTYFLDNWTRSRNPHLNFRPAFDIKNKQTNPICVKVWRTAVATVAPTPLPHSKVWRPELVLTVLGRPRSVDLLSLT